FFQAEDGIRDFHVTGVQTCALPILLIHLDLFGLGWRNVFLVNVPLGLLTLAGAARVLPAGRPGEGRTGLDLAGVGLLSAALLLRSEERRVGKEGRCRCAAGE